MDGDDEGLTVYGDRNGISQVISNIISNSIKFIPQDGTISIKAERKATNSDIEGVKEMVVVSVKDTGIGIDEEVFPRLFTKFITKNPFRGLAWVYSYQKAWGSAWWKHMAEHNRDGKGATDTDLPYLFKAEPNISILPLARLFSLNQ